MIAPLDIKMELIISRWLGIPAKTAVGMDCRRL